MLFALLIPFISTDVADEITQHERQGPKWLSRSHSRSQSLEQRWQDHTDMVAPVTGPAGGFTISKLATCRIENRTVARLDVEVDSDSLLEESLSHLEETLSSLAVDTLASIGFDSSLILWVGRYGLVDALESLPDSWFSSGLQRIDLTDTAGATGRPQSDVRVSWGNGAVIGWDSLTPDTQGEVVEGLVDAQHLWASLDSLGTESSEVARSLVRLPESGRSKRKVVHVRRRISSISSAALFHNLAFDETLLTIQGHRREIVDAALKAWGYAATSARIFGRIDQLEDMASGLHQRLENRYQSVVEIVLLGLGLLTLLDFVLSLISTAFSGSVSGYPGENGGFFEVIRASDTGTLTLLSGLLTVTILLVLTLRRVAR